MSWKEFFMDNPETEEMYQAFKERMEDDDEYFDAHDERRQRAEQAERERKENHYLCYEKVEYYRQQYALRKGYTFKPKEYDPEAKY